MLCSGKCRRVLHCAVGLFGVVVLIATMALAWLLSGSRMVYNGYLELDRLENGIDIHFDKNRRPYVRSRSFADALFAQGFLHARERFWQMDLLRRAGSARLSALLGGSLSDTDIGLWRAGVTDFAEQLADNASSELTRWMRAYTDGVNAGLASMRTPPPEYLLLGTKPDQWQIRDSYAIGAIMAFDSSGNHDRELLRNELLSVLSEERFEIFHSPDLEEEDFPYAWRSGVGDDHAAVDETDILKAGSMRGGDNALGFLSAVSPHSRPFGGSIRFGSNGWVVAPQRSSDRRALFAFDSHDAVGLPNLFYEVHLFFGSGKQLRGWSVPGLPGVINGFNARRAWGFTNIGDSQDLVAFENPPEPVGTERRTFDIHGQEDVEAQRRITAHRPLISEDPPLAFRWVAHDLEDSGRPALDMTQD